MTGLFFGSFNPPHIGHVNTLITALKSPLIDSIEVIPAIHNPWKEFSVDWDIRIDMIKETFNIPKITVNEIEKKLVKSNIVYTYEVLQLFNPNKNIIITTPETYNQISDWYNGDLILEKFKFLIVASKHFDCGNLPKDTNIIFSRDIEICSTDIRNMIKKGLNPSPFITPSVESIIRIKNLYK